MFASDHILCIAPLALAVAANANYNINHEMLIERLWKRHNAKSFVSCI